MYPISRQAFEKALQNALDIEKHGKAFKQMAKPLGGRLLTREQVELIEQAGEQIQQCGQTMKDLAEGALQDEKYSLEVYAWIHEQHCQAVSLYIQSIQMVVLATQSLL